MADAMRAMLDELMGKDRDLPAEERAELAKKRHFSDPEHCRHWLCGMCPHTLFTSTKRDLGPCGKEHDKDMQAMYMNDPRNKEKYPYEDDLARYLRKIKADVAQRVAKGKQRLEKPAPPLLTPEQMAKVQEMEDQIQELNVKAEMAGESGDVDQAQVFATMTENLGKRLSALKNQSNPLALNEKEQVVCDVCGAIEDVQTEGMAPNRREDHLRGKLHVGHQKIIDHLEAYEKWRDGLRKESARRDDDRGQRDHRRERDRSRSRERHRDRDRDYHRDYHRDRDRDRDHFRGGGGHRERDRDLSPDRRDRDRRRY